MPFDTNRLLTILNNTGLQTKDNSLYQLLKQLIEGIGSLNGQVNSINNAINIINETITNTVSTVVQLSLGTENTDSNNSNDMFMSSTPSTVLPGGITASLASFLSSESGTDGIDGINGIDGRNGIDGKDAVSLIPQDGIDGIDSLSLFQSISSTNLASLTSNPTQLISGLGIDSSESEPNTIPFYLNAADVAMLGRTNEFRIVSNVVYFRLVAEGEAQFTVWADKSGVSSDTDAFLRFVIDEGELLKGLMGYDQGLDRFILGYNGISGIRIDSSGNFEIPINLSKYKGVNTAGWALPAIYASGRLTGRIAAVATVSSYTVGAADGSFEINANVNVTSSTSFSFNVRVSYTDETNTARTVNLTFSNPSGAIAIGITNTVGAGAYVGSGNHRIRCKASTTITVGTTGTFTTVTYNVEADIKQVA